MFELSHQHCRFTYTMYNVHGMKCRYIIMYMYKMPLYPGSRYASEQYEDSDSQTLYTCTHIHVHRGYNYMYMTVHAVATASYYNIYIHVHYLYTRFPLCFPLHQREGPGNEATAVALTWSQTCTEGGCRDTCCHTCSWGTP